MGGGSFTGQPRVIHQSLVHGVHVEVILGGRLEVVGGLSGEGLQHFFSAHGPLGCLPVHLISTHHARDMRAPVGFHGFAFSLVDLVEKGADLFKRLAVIEAEDQQKDVTCEEGQMAQDNKLSGVYNVFPSVWEEQPRSSTIKGDEIQALEIRDKDLEELHAPRPPKENQKPAGVTRFVVRKSKPKEEKRTVHLTVARPAPEDAAVQTLDYTGACGVRFDSQGRLLVHSFLGTVEDLRKEAARRGDTELLQMIPRPTDPMHDPLDLIDAAPEIPACDGCQGEPAGQTLALDNWQQHMAERRKQQEYMSRALQKPVTELIMNKSENYRRIQEERHLIDRSLPRMLNGKGYRVGSEFWNQPRHMGDELCGITMTLTQTEQGYPEPLARIGQPLCVRSETGSVSPSRHHTWEKSSYLQRRREDLKSVLKDLDLSQPDFDGLEVLGSGFPLTSVSVEHYPLTEEMEDENEKENTDPLQDYPDVMMEPILGPSLLIGGKRAQWTGNASSHEGEVGITARLTFEALAEMPATSSLDVTNNGSASVYFSWKRLPHVVSFEDIQGGQKTQRFYFDTGSGVILPGDKQQFLFTFKSPNAGIFSETWELSTHPTLLGGAGIQVTLRGIALHDDRTAEMRQTIQQELETKETQKIVGNILDGILDGVRTPERPSTPADAYLTEEDIFHQQNPELHFVHSAVEGLKNLWNQWLQPAEWDLNARSFREVVLSAKLEDQAWQEEALAEMNRLVLEMSRPPYRPRADLLHHVGLQLWRETIDGMDTQAASLRHLLGITEGDTWALDLQDDIYNSRGTKLKKGSTQKEDKKGAVMKEKEEKKPAGKPGAKERQLEERPPSKKGKQKEEKKAIRGPMAVGKEATSSSDSFDSERSDGSPVDPVLQDTYRRELHIRVNELLESMVENMSDLFEEVKSSEPSGGILK
ncbi:MYCBP-associated protein isoform X2 [Polypterus senegalus]|uniref:MYCBP-associated protein isoform X2 n=1 Tax=Polypterus senegalus TaxID=55291 RepID=UPI00196518D5|nr:MYCBP-associated protein isoform X2 [Polypterus senegalus]